MKKTITCFLFALCLLPLPVFAGGKTVTTLANGTISTIIIPGPRAHTITIQNKGSNSAVLGFDGGPTYKDPDSGNFGRTITATDGYLLPAGASLIIAVGANAGPVFRPPIVATMVSGSTTLDVSTDDFLSMFPTS